MTRPLMAGTSLREQFRSAVTVVMLRHRLTHQQLADILGISVHSLASWRWRGNSGAWTVYQVWLRGPFLSSEIAGDIIQECYPAIGVSK